MNEILRVIDPSQSAADDKSQERNFHVLASDRGGRLVLEDAKTGRVLLTLPAREAEALAEFIGRAFRGR